MNNHMLSSSSITGTDVKNLAGENLGNIKDLMIDTDSGEVKYAVLSFGGFLGLGDKYFAVPWKSFSIDRKSEDFVLNVSEDRLKDAPGFDKDNWPNFANPYFDTVSKYYGHVSVV